LNEQQLKPDQHRLQTGKCSRQFLQAVSGHPHGQPQKQAEPSTQPGQCILQAPGRSWNKVEEYLANAPIGYQSGQCRKYQQNRNKQREAAFGVTKQEGILGITGNGK